MLQDSLRPFTDKFHESNTFERNDLVPPLNSLTKEISQLTGIPDASYFISVYNSTRFPDDFTAVIKNVAKVKESRSQIASFGL